MKNKNLPVFIIVIVFIVAVIGAIALYRNPGNTPANTNTGKNTNQAAEFPALLAKAPQGAQPAWSKGDPAAKVTIEEFADFACPTCALFHNSLKEIEKSYGSRIKVTFRHFPLQIKGHENAYDAARAAEAAGEQGRFWEMQNMLFTNQKTWQPSTEPRKLFSEYAKSIGLDVQRFETDLIGQGASSRVANDMKRAQAINVSGTPTVILNGRLLSNNEITNIEALRQAIETELQKANQPAAPSSNAANAPANQ